MSIQKFLARVGPLVEGIANSPKGSKIHAVRANDERSWCGRWGITPVSPQRKWEPGDQPPRVYCVQCLYVWNAARNRNDEVKELLTEIEQLYAERKQRV